MMLRHDVLLLLLLLLTAVGGMYGWTLPLDESAGSVAGEGWEPYCNVNVTTYTTRMVQKTRQVVQRPTGILRFMKKPKTFAETYEDTVQVPNVISVRGCCDGYNMNSLQVCEPVCGQGCPRNARCVHPNVCQCAMGHVSVVSPKDGTRHCEAVCEKPCPKNSHCAEPNVCNCLAGYRVQYLANDEEACVPHCTGECGHVGTCISPEQCHCPAGYRAARDGACTRRDRSASGSDGTTVVDYDFTTDLISVSESEEVSSDATSELPDYYDLSDEKMDMNEKIYLPTEKSAELCPDGTVYYNGKCQEQTFPSNLVDCHIIGCPENAICKADGNCVCDFYYIRVENDTSVLDNTNDTTSLRCVLDTTFMEMSESTSLPDWVVLFIIGVVTVLIILAILISLMALHRRRGRLNVQQQNDVTFKYTTPASNDSNFVY